MRWGVSESTIDKAEAKKIGLVLHSGMKLNRSPLRPRILIVSLVLAVFIISVDAQQERIYSSKPVSSDTPAQSNQNSLNSSSSMGYAPPVGTPLRQQILDSVRARFGSETQIHETVIFKVNTLSVVGDHAIAILAPLHKSGQPLQNVRRCVATLRNANGSWQAEQFKVNPTDAEISSLSNSFVAGSKTQSPTNADTQDERKRALQEKEAELNRRAAELDQRAAEIERRAAQINQSSSPPPQMATVRAPSSVATESPPVASSPQSLSNSSIVTTKSEAGGTDRNSTESQEPKYDEILPILTSDVITYFKLVDQVNTERKRFVFARSTDYQQKRKQLRDLAARIYNQTYSIKLGDLAGAEYEVAKKSFPITIGSNFAMVALDCWPPKTIKGIQFSSFPTATEPMLSGAQISNEILHLNVDEQTALQIENNSNSYEVLVYFKIKGVEKKEFTCLDSNGQRWKGTKPVIATTNNSVVVRNKDTNQVVLRKDY